MRPSIITKILRASAQQLILQRTPPSIILCESHIDPVSALLPKATLTSLRDKMGIKGVLFELDQTVSQKKDARKSKRRRNFSIF